MIEGNAKNGAETDQCVRRRTGREMLLNRAEGLRREAAGLELLAAALPANLPALSQGADEALVNLVATLRF